MWQAQEKDFERGKCRKGEQPVCFGLGRAVKSRTTVIGTMGSYQIERNMKLTPYGQLYFV